MNVLIIEDEEIAAEKLSLLVRRYDPAIRVLDCLDSVKNAVKWLSQHPAPDLLFLDIYLSDGLSFEIFQKVNVQVPVIFTTAYNEYAIRAFQLNSVDYLLKPIKAEDIARSLDKFRAVRQQYAQSAPAPDYAALLRLMAAGQKGYKERFLVRQGQKIVSVPVQEVAYFYASEKIVLLVTTENRHIPVDYSLDQLAELLNPAEFFKLNRQFVVRESAIEHMYPYSNSRIKVTLRPQEPKEVIVSNDRVGPFKQWLDR
ncbi:MAG: response regulator transcription factor [Cytophagales bacterium]|nr:response regulator transcription factor [Cytophagales bacterium]